MLARRGYLSSVAQLKATKRPWAELRSDHKKAAGSDDN